MAGSTEFTTDPGSVGMEAPHGFVLAAGDHHRLTHGFEGFWVTAHPSAIGLNVLVLNRHYLAIRVINVKRAFNLLCRRMAEGGLYALLYRTQFEEDAQPA